MPTALLNPFTTLPVTQCGNVDIPALPVCQDGIAYRQKRSQIGGLILLPIGADRPSDWTDAASWLEIIDNTDTTNTAAKYLVGRGSFALSQQVELNLASGRYVANRERAYRLAFNVANMNDAHTEFGRKLQNNIRAFDFWVQTIDDRIIGGEFGMRPFFVNADFPFAEGNNDRENMAVTLDTWMLNIPAMTASAVDISTPSGGGGAGGCGCDITTLLRALPEYVNDDDAIADGLDSGDPYWVLPGNDIQPADTIRRVP